MLARTFDPTALSVSQSKQFYELLKARQGILFTGETYKVSDLTDPGGPQESIKTKYAIIPRKNKKGEPRYEVVMEGLGAGAQGLVFAVGTLVPQPDGSLKYKQATKFSQQQYVVKIESLPDYPAERKKIIEDKKLIAARVPYLYAKDPVVIVNANGEEELVTVYKRFPGKPLDKIIDDKRLTTELRYAISLRLAQQLQDIHHAEIIHRDIKPENILVDIDFENQRIRSIKIIDFDSAIDSSKKDGYICGTRGYIDPEYEDTKKANKKSDVYSLGKTFAKLWRKDPNSFDMAPLISSMTAKTSAKRIDLAGTIDTIIEKQHEHLHTKNPAIEAGNRAALAAQAELKVEEKKFVNKEYAGKHDEYLNQIIAIIAHHALKLNKTALTHFLAALQIESLPLKSTPTQLVEHLNNLKLTFHQQLDSIMQMTDDTNVENNARAEYMLSKLSKCATLDDYQRFIDLSAAEFQKEEKKIEAATIFTDPKSKNDPEKTLSHLLENIGKAQDLDQLKNYFDHIETNYQFLRQEKGGFSLFQAYGTTENWRMLISAVQNKAYELAYDKTFSVTPDEDKFLTRIFSEKNARVVSDRSKEKQYMKMKIIDNKTPRPN